MGSEWTDESVIRRDLSRAQGQWVPCGIDAVVAGEKPPTHVITEETEEEYYEHWTADGDFSTAPDFSMIKKMLDMVHDETPEEDVPPLSRSAEIEIVKATLKPPFTLKKKAAKEKPKPRRARNAAIASLLALQATEIPMKLAKPDDFIKPNKEDIEALKRKNESVKKVNSWLHTQNLNNMFKKKCSNKENENVENNNLKIDRISEKRDKKCTSYIPTSSAREYYESFVKRSQMAQIVKENIWAKAENMMREIDERKAEQIRKQQEVEAALNAVLDLVDVEILKKTEENGHSEHSEPTEAAKDFSAIAKIELPQHRHQLTGECIVCKVLVKN